MVYVVRKKIKGGIYLYLHRTVLVPETGNYTTEYVKYLGKEGEVADEEIKAKIAEYKGRKDENKRSKRQGKSRKNRS